MHENNTMIPVFAALDTTDLKQGHALAARLKPYIGGVKLGLEFFAAHGPDGVRRFADLGLPIFLDLKFHDIPNTVAGAVRAAAKLGVDILNVHAAGGPAMLKSALEAARSVNPKTKVIAVTVLTSLADADLEAVGQHGPAGNQVLRLARLTRDCGLGWSGLFRARDRGSAGGVGTRLSPDGAGNPAQGCRLGRPAAGDGAEGGSGCGRQFSGDRPAHHRRSGPDARRPGRLPKAWAFPKLSAVCLILGRPQPISPTHAGPGQNLRD